MGGFSAAPSIFVLGTPKLKTGFYPKYVCFSVSSAVEKTTVYISTKFATNISATPRVLNLGKAAGHLSIQSTWSIT